MKVLKKKDQNYLSYIKNISMRHNTNCIGVCGNVCSG